ncbi:glycosyl hydrolase family 28-related protein [Streptomyces griseoaurantiacus]|uniref:glycosyl hydrolase family 28-related protein n=1 Tax=Streptomyces griseoaurantiacus TaxID=68213 RepID=UPI00369A70EF
MTFTMVPITRTYTDGSGQPRSGSVRLQLTGVMVNGDQTADRKPVVLALDEQGSISTQFWATNDPGTLPPSGGVVEVTESLSGLDTSVYYIEVPFDGGPVDLATAPRLAEVTPPAVFFQPLNQRNLPNGYPGLDGSGRVSYDQLPTDIGSGGGEGGGATPISGDDADVQPLGTRAAGSSGTAADARHVHAMPALHEVRKPTASLDLNGQRLTNAAAGVEATDVATVGQLGQSVLGWANVKDAQYGAKGDGSTDDTLALQAALNACPPGGVVYLPAGVYRTSAPLSPPPGVSLQGTHASLASGAGLSDPACYIQPLASFTGSAAILFKDQSSGGYPAIPAEQRLTGIMIDGSAVDDTKLVDGIYAAGSVKNVVLDTVTVRKMSGNGLATAGISNLFPTAWRLRSVVVDSCRASGIVATQLSDLVMDEVTVTGCTGTGIKLVNTPNSTLTGCRAERNGAHGFWINGAWGNGSTSGGAALSACSTDRNGQHGVLVDATGNGPLILTGLRTRRDGRNGGSGGGSYAGLAFVGSTLPVVATGITCYPGTDDNGTGTSSPQYGARLSGASNVQMDVLYLHGATQGLYDDGTNTAVTVGATVTSASGPTTAPSRATRPAYAIDWLNVKQYGAKGDGVTNDAAAIQAAITAATAIGGGTLYFPAGRYILNSALTWASGVNAVGAGSRVSILQSTNQNLDCISGTDVGDITLEKLQLSGPGRGFGSGVRFTRFSAPSTVSITLRDVLIQSFGGDGVFCHELASSTLQRVRVRNCGGVGFHLQAPQSTLLGGSSTSLTGCSAEGCVGGGYWLDGMAYTALSACAASNTPAGYRLDSCASVSLTACGAEQCTTGLIVYGGSGNSASGFVTRASDGTSVWVTNAATGVVLSGVSEVAPVAAATTCVRTDTGTSAMLLGITAVKPNALSGTVIAPA